ncbi:ESPR domain-containing protein [Vitreoscilla massiliensis]|uniref:ESPR domain-containing protein n=1 Tax=Vitreoscilla massiliensis TaxID=1689272 RepID=A0ABY4DZR0_9NEIS|nr:ESPR domain-containing protein [Vitreoscilla massiliensis]UOO88610.1 ESPR domain-containing protein [Vitreoscilla massiliensis]
MNRTYRVVYNHSTGTYVAVAENTTARKKSSTTVKTVIAALSVPVMVMGLSGTAHASFKSSDAASSQFGNNYVAIGEGAQVGTSSKSANNSIAIGNNAKAQYGQSTPWVTAPKL